MTDNLTAADSNRHFSSKKNAQLGSARDIFGCSSPSSSMSRSDATLGMDVTVLSSMHQNNGGYYPLLGLLGSPDISSLQQHRDKDRTTAPYRARLNAHNNLSETFAGFNSLVFSNNPISSSSSSRSSPLNAKLRSSSSYWRNQPIESMLTPLNPISPLTETSSSPRPQSQQQSNRNDATT